MRHDVEQDFVFRLEVVIEAALGKLEGGGNIVHGSGIVSLLLKEPGGGSQDFLAGFRTEFRTTFNGSFAEHHQRWYRGKGSGLYQAAEKLDVALDLREIPQVQEFFEFEIAVREVSASPRSVFYDFL
jgi:hypothetical protein